MYLISKQIYLDNHNKCYKTIIIINGKPKGKICDFVTNIRLGKLSESEHNYGCCNKNLCIYAFKSLNNNCCQLMCMDEYPNLITFLSTEILRFGFLPPYKIAGISPSALNLLLEPDEVFSLLIAFKLLIIYFERVYNLRCLPKQELIE